jgi:hypothetical protein
MSTLGLTYLVWWRDAPIDFATWKKLFPHHIEIAENKVSDACHYRDALPLGRVYREDSTTTAAMNHALSQVVSPIWGRRAFNCLKSMRLPRGTIGDAGGLL